MGKRGEILKVGVKDPREGKGEWEGLGHAVGVCVSVPPAGVRVPPHPGVELGKVGEGEPGCPGEGEESRGVGVEALKRERVGEGEEVPGVSGEEEGGWLV